MRDEMPVGSLPAFNLLGGDEPKRKEEQGASEKPASGFSSQMSGLWEQKKDREKGGLLVPPQVGNLWDSATGKKQREKQKDSFSLFGSTPKKKSSIDWGPGGAIGIGCGVGIGVGLTGTLRTKP